MVNPKLNGCVPTLFIPVAAEDTTVAPVIVQVNFVTVQLSAIGGLVVTTDFVHDPAVTLVTTLPEQAIVGKVTSTAIIIILAEFEQVVTVFVPTTV